jgi:hypothetical protein
LSITVSYQSFMMHHVFRCKGSGKKAGRMGGCM